MRRNRLRKRTVGIKAVTRRSAARPLSAPSALALKHRIIECRSLAMHCLIALKITGDPALLDRARRNLASWCNRYGTNVPRAFEEWRQILGRPWPEIAALITDPAEQAARLRQSSPFAGLLTPEERLRVYEAFRA